MPKKSKNVTKISIIIPVFTGHENLKYLLPAINQQTLHPCEIIIVDSCPHTEVQELIDNIHIEIPIHYHREDKRAFPGKARNIGVSIAKHEYIAFLDCRTIPSDNWLQHYSQLIKDNDASMIKGSFTVLANNKFQWYLRIALYGERTHESVPGMLMKKRLFESTGGFDEDLRMAEDLEWIKRLRRKQIKLISVATPFLKYDGLPESFFSACRKYFKSGYYTSFVMENFKNLLFGVFLLAAILVIPKWNFYLVGWDSNPLFVPNLTKIVFLIVSSLLLIWRLIYVLTPRVLPANIFVLSGKLTILGILTLSVYNWNASMALWVEDAVLYIPHITKIYVGLLIGSVFIYRGIIRPMINNTTYEKLLPMNWLLVGMVGLAVDIAKIPGIMFGVIAGRVKELARSLNSVKKQDR